jgi:hypothetical protein
LSPFFPGKDEGYLDLQVFQHYSKGKIKFSMEENNINIKLQIFFIIIIILGCVCWGGELEFELRASHLQSRHFTTWAWATPPVHFVLVILKMGVSWTTCLSRSQTVMLLILAYDHKCESLVPVLFAYKILALNRKCSNTLEDRKMWPKLKKGNIQQL